MHTLPVRSRVTWKSIYISVTLDNKHKRLAKRMKMHANVLLFLSVSHPTRYNSCIRRYVASGPRRNFWATMFATLSILLPVLCKFPKSPHAHDPGRFNWVSFTEEYGMHEAWTILSEQRQPSSWFSSSYECFPSLETAISSRNEVYGRCLFNDTSPWHLKRRPQSMRFQRATVIYSLSRNFP